MSWSVVRPAGLTPANARLEHSEEANHRIKGVVPVREAALNFLPEAILNSDALGVSPAKERCAELFPVGGVALAAERLFGEPGVAFCRVGFGYNDVSWHKQGGQGDEYQLSTTCPFRGGFLRALRLPAVPQNQRD